jgi:hypothetical protein
MYKKISTLSFRKNTISERKEACIAPITNEMDEDDTKRMKKKKGGFA